MLLVISIFLYMILNCIGAFIVLKMICDILDNNKNTKVPHRINVNIGDTFINSINNTYGTVINKDGEIYLFEYNINSLFTEIEEVTEVVNERIDIYDLRSLIRQGILVKV